MNYIHLQLLNIDISSIFYYIASIFNDINFDIVLTIFLVINTLLAFSIVFIEYQATTSSWAWILVLFLIPYLGFILYLILFSIFPHYILLYKLHQILFFHLLSV